jgi:hypothetical protein
MWIALMPVAPQQSSTASTQEDETLCLRGGGCCTALCCPCVFIWGGITALVSRIKANQSTTSDDSGAVGRCRESHHDAKTLMLYSYQTPSWHLLIVTPPRFVVRQCTRCHHIAGFQGIQPVHLVIVKLEIEDLDVVGDSRGCLGFTDHHVSTMSFQTPIVYSLLLPSVPQ